MILTAPFAPVGVTMSQCPIRILDCRLNLRISLFHWSLTPTGLKSAVGSRGRQSLLCSALKKVEQSRENVLENQDRAEQSKRFEKSR